MSDRNGWNMCSEWMTTG